MTGYNLVTIAAAGGPNLAVGPTLVSSALIGLLFLSPYKLQLDFKVVTWLSKLLFIVYTLV